MIFWLSLAIAAFVGAHGLVYLIAPFTPMAPRISKGWRGSSAALGTHVPRGAIESLTSALWVVAGALLLISAAAIVFAAGAPWLWRPLAIGSSLVGVASFAVFYDGQSSLFVNQGGVGMLISLAIAAGAASFPAAFP